MVKERAEQRKPSHWRAKTVGVLGVVAALAVVTHLPQQDASNGRQSPAACEQTREPVGAACVAHKSGTYLLVMHELIFESVQAKQGESFSLVIDRSGNKAIECDRRHPKTYTIEFAPGPADESEVIETYNVC